MKNGSIRRYLRLYGQEDDIEPLPVNGWAWDKSVSSLLTSTVDPRDRFEVTFLMPCSPLQTLIFTFCKLVPCDDIFDRSVQYSKHTECIRPQPRCLHAFNSIQKWAAQLTREMVFILAICQKVWGHSKPFYFTIVISICKPWNRICITVYTPFPTNGAAILGLMKPCLTSHFFNIWIYLFSVIITVWRKSLSWLNVVCQFQWQVVARGKSLPHADVQRREPRSTRRVSWLDQLGSKSLC
jgi:hypothetical protein